MKGQVSIEHLTLVLFVLTTVVVTYYAYVFLVDAPLKISMAQEALDQIGLAADNVYSHGGEVMVTVNLPEGLTAQNIENGVLQYSLNVGLGDSTLITVTDVNDLRGKLPLDQGVRRVKVSLLGSGKVLIGSGVTLSPDTPSASTQFNQKVSLDFNVANQLDEDVNSITYHVTGDFNSNTWTASFNGILADLASGQEDAFELELTPSVLVDPGFYSGKVVVEGVAGPQTLTDSSDLTITVTPTSLACSMVVNSYADSACLTPKDTFNSGEKAYFKVSTDTCSVSDANLQVFDPNNSLHAEWTNMTVSNLVSECKQVDFSTNPVQGDWTAVAMSTQANKDSDIAVLDQVCELRVRTYKGLACTGSASTEFFEGDTVFIKAESSPCISENALTTLKRPDGSTADQWSELLLTGVGACYSYELKNEQAGSWSIDLNSDNAVSASQAFELDPKPNAWYEMPDYFKYSIFSTFNTLDDEFSLGQNVHILARANDLGASLTTSRWRSYNDESSIVNFDGLDWDSSENEATGNPALLNVSAYRTFEIFLDDGTNTFRTVKQAKVGDPSATSTGFLSLYDTVGATGCEGSQVTDWSVAKGETVCVQVQTDNFDDQEVTSSSLRLSLYDESVADANFDVFSKASASNTYFTSYTIPSSLLSDYWYNFEVDLGTATDSFWRGNQVYVE